jgi:hypothetical protein
LVSFLALRDQPTLARTPPIKVWLDIGFGQSETRRAAVDDAADTAAMALTESGDTKDASKGACHVSQDTQ